jgi:hypothetical protein
MKGDGMANINELKTTAFQKISEQKKIEKEQLKKEIQL